MINPFHKKKKILIVEDHEPLRQLLKIGLAPTGATILEASNGKEGLHSIREENPDLVLLDLMMPVMDGLTLLRKVREENPSTSHPRVLIITNSDHGTLIEDTVNLGVAGFIRKSDWKMEEIIEMVKKWL